MTYFFLLLLPLVHTQHSVLSITLPSDRALASSLIASSPLCLTGSVKYSQTPPVLYWYAVTLSRLAALPTSTRLSILVFFTSASIWHSNLLPSSSKLLAPGMFIFVGLKVLGLPFSSVQCWEKQTPRISKNNRHYGTSEMSKKIFCEEKIMKVFLRVVCDSCTVSLSLSLIVTTAKLL